MGNDALHVNGLHGPGDKISLLLKDWKLAKVAWSCRMALDMLCQELHQACSGVMLPRGLLSSHRGRAVTSKERSWWTQRACWFPSFQFLL